MNKKFEKITRKMPKLLDKLRLSQPLSREALRRLPEKGVYVFYDGSQPIYVGRSNGMRQRILTHGRRSASHNTAALAFKMAREQLGDRVPDGIQRADLEKMPAFGKCFDKALDRVRRMKVCFVEIEDQHEQYLFEFYAALALSTTKYNDFGTH